MKKIICFIAVLCLLSVVLCSCGEGGETGGANVKMTDLTGTWEIVEKLEDVSSLKQKFKRSDDAAGAGSGFFEEEIALMNFDDICAVKTLTFTESGENAGTYEYAYDKDATYTYLKKFFEDYLSACYAKLPELTECYGQETVDTLKSFEDFKTFYGEMFGCTDYDSLIDTLCGFVFNSEMYAAPIDKGAFEISGNMLLMTQQPDEMYVQLDETTGEEQKQEKVGASIKDGALTLSYKSGTETYTKR